MIKVVRKDPYGHNGFKFFETKEEAEKFVMSNKVQQDIADGFQFQILLDKEMEKLK